MCLAEAAVENNRRTGHGFSNFTQLYDEFYAGNTLDTIEFAMWWEGVAGSNQANYGAYGADGVFEPRADCGGVAALRAGVERVHAMGRRVHL